MYLYYTKTKSYMFVGMKPTTLLLNMEHTKYRYD